MKDWGKNMISQIDEKLKDTRDRDKRFFRIEEFKRNIARVDSFSPKCPVCNQQKQDIKEVVDEIDVAIDQPGRKRRRYDQLIGKLASHMQKEHHFYTPLYFTYLYSFYGIVAGVVGGFLLLNLFQIYGWPVFSISLVLGMISGYLKGGRKDSVIRASKKLM